MNWAVETRLRKCHLAHSLRPFKPLTSNMDLVSRSEARNDQPGRLAFSKGNQSRRQRGSSGVGCRKSISASHSSLRMLSSAEVERGAIYQGTRRRKVARSTTLSPAAGQRPARAEIPRPPTPGNDGDGEEPSSSFATASFVKPV